jgi:pimeloyl-ACP methyl ester carboxylesterase
MDSFEDCFVTVRGVKTRYWQAGSSGSAVILLHGIGCSVLDWQTNIRALAARHRVYALDMLGYGLTEKPRDETYTIPQLAQFTPDFLSTQEIQRARKRSTSPLTNGLTRRNASRGPQKANPAQYRRRDWAAEKRAALDSWATHVVQLLRKYCRY